MKSCFQLLVFLLSFFPVHLSAQPEQYQFSKLNIANGLSNNQVTSVLKDSRGFMWFGTQAGLNRYDGYKFKVFRHDLSDSSSINDDFIVHIEEGPENKLWISTRFGFNIYDPKTERFSHDVSKYLKQFSIPTDEIVKILKDKQGNFLFLHKKEGVFCYNPITKHTTVFLDKSRKIKAPYSAVSLGIDSKDFLWISYSNGSVEKFDRRKNKAIYVLNNLKSKLNSKITYWALVIDKQDDIWLYARNFPTGVYCFNQSNKSLKRFNSGSPHSKLSSDIISGIIQDREGLIWITTDHGGINILNKRTFSIKYIVNAEDDDKSLAQNSIASLYKDNTGIIWIGTYKKGVSYYHPNIIKFPLIRHHLSNPKSLGFEDVNKFAEDAVGNIWIGTNGGGLIYYNRKAGSFSRFRHNPADPTSLSSDIIVSLFIDRHQKLWIGTYYGGLDCYDGSRFIHHKHDESNPASISDDRIWEIKEDAENNLWVGTLAGGLNRLDLKTGIFHHFKAYIPNSIHSEYISAIVPDRSGNLWIGTANGIEIYQKKTKQFKRLIHNDKDSNSLIYNTINNILIDSRDLVWITTREGISMFNPKTNKFINFRKEDGLPDNTVLGVLEDERHNLWFSTKNGLSNVLIKNVRGMLTFQFINYDEKDGLQGREFNEDASLKTSKGELIFGGANGFNIFHPAMVKSSVFKPAIVLTDFQVFNKSLMPGQEVNGSVVLSKSITETKDISLKYNQNVFSIEFAALNYFNPDKVRLQYMLEGFDDGWLNADPNLRKATYTNLDPGHYFFKVKAIAGESTAEQSVLVLNVNILPPFWRTNFAYFLYFAFALGSLLYLRRRGIANLKTQFALEQERQEAQRMRDLDLLKIKFFTNVSHEFRTPLSLILAPVDKILKQIEDQDLKRQVQMINVNAKRLLNLVNQLLDIRRMEVQEFKLNSERADIVSFLKEVTESFSDMADKKHIRYLFDSDIDSLELDFDKEKIERVLFNLLSNAFKFTPSEGNISVLLSLRDPGNEAEKQLEIKVIDTGIGIPKEKHTKIFERFFQNDLPGTMLNQGSGIGLSITKEFVKLHGGEIKVDSASDEGSCFTVVIPVRLDRIMSTEPEVAVDVQTSKSKVFEKKPVVLIVEDNEDFRFYLKDNLKDTFQIIEAANGREGWQKALALHPNLIVSDITMPEMNGIELCTKLKTDKRTLHIPVVLLTALTGEEEQIKGLETGASDYLTKPFNFEILLSKLRNILQQQQSMRKTYQKQLEVVPSAVTEESPDEKFIQKALQVIEKNMANADFSVEELSSELYVSRVTLYKKILALTGKTPVEFIRGVRVKRAAQLIEKGHSTISQIAYKVGFKSQKYFVKCFKAEFNTLPSTYLEEKRLQQLD